MADSPLKAVSRIARRLLKTGRTVGLELRGFTVTPDLESEDGPHHAQAIFTLNEDFVPEPPKDEAWEKFEEEQAKHAAEERAQEAREGLTELAKNLESGRDAGIL